MNKILAKLQANNFESSSSKTLEFSQFARDFKKEFIKELQTIGANFDSFGVGHFYVSGFFKKGEQLFYFSISDVRHGFGTKLLYRTAKHNKDWTGGSNRYAQIETGMASKMILS